MTVRILRGHVLDRLRDLPDESVHCCVTSPPYYGLRDYGVPGQLGLEPTLAEYLEKMVTVFREVRRVLRSDGTLWLNIGDSYANDAKWGGSTGGKHVSALHDTAIGRGKKDTGLKPKDLMGVPWRLAFALQADGWYLRSDIIWHKRSTMPESVRDRPTKSHEHIFLLAKSESYFYDQVAASEPCEPFPVRVPAGWATGDAPHNAIAHQTADSHRKVKRSGNKERKDATDRGCPESGVAGSIPWEGSTRNWRDVWHLGPEPFKEAHFATFPTEIPRRAIVAGTSEKGCCASCGAPWARVVDRQETKSGESLESRLERRGQDFMPEKGPNRPDTMWQVPVRYDLSQSVRITNGWVPSCSCDGADTRPAAVLDPFLGSGTTALVADRLQRDCIGIELNAEYAAMAERRIRGDAPLFAEVA